MENNLTDNKINYKYILNKIFTGSFLDYNLGHEIINFIKTPYFLLTPSILINAVITENTTKRATTFNIVTVAKELNNIPIMDEIKTNNKGMLNTLATPNKTILNGS